MAAPSTSWRLDRPLHVQTPYGRLTPSRVCNINTQTQRADLVRNADLIIWDELPMTHRFCVEALDRSLRDITHNKLFGGKTIPFPVTGVK